MSTQKTQQEIVRETIKYYETHPRAVNRNTGKCEYATKEGNHCAFSRCCTPEAVEQINQAFQGDNVHAILYEGGIPLDSLLKPEYHGHDVYFWGRVQELHDTGSFWAEHPDGTREFLTTYVVYEMFGFEYPVK